MWNRLLLPLCLLMLLTGCASPNDNAPSSNEALNAAPQSPSGANHNGAEDSPPVVDTKPEDIASEIVALLKDRDMLRLAAYVHPEQGVRFSPYGYVDAENDIVLSAVELQNAMEDTEKRVWGSYDGSGEPIALTFAEYMQQFVYDRDYAAAPEIGYNEPISQGNSINNVKDVYPNGFVAEYHFPGTEAYDGMDWSSLRIVLEQVGGTWACIALIHDQWTI